jgi:hypothetical protein
MPLYDSCVSKKHHFLHSPSFLFHSCASSRRFLISGKHASVLA